MTVSKKAKLSVSALLIIGCLIIGGYAVDQYLASAHASNNAQSMATKVAQSQQFNGRQFENIGQVTTKPAIWPMLKMYMFDKQQPASPTKPIKVHNVSKAQLLALQKSADTQGMVFYRLGHSSLLIMLDGEFLLTDPVFSERASPFSFMGPKRFHQPPINIDELPKIKAVILSHNHYDHLDKAAIKKLISKVEHFYTPLGVGEDLIKWGVKRENVTQLDWWESVTVKSIQLTATPAQHFSARSLSDKNRTLWSSWAVKGEQASFFFSGDSGYFEQFKVIGEQLGPFDVSFIETGAYNKMWSEIHMHPRESAQAHIDLQATYLVPIHNGTFDLSLHAWVEPLEKISQLAKELGLSILTPSMGEEVSLKALEKKSVKENSWWR